MPTLIRLFVFLVFLAGLGFAGMYVLTVAVDPGEKDITIKIPARELVPASQPIDLNNLPAPINIAPKDSPSASLEAPRSSASSSAASSADAASSAPSSAVAAGASEAEPSIDTTDSAASAPGVKTVDVGGGE